MKFTGKFTRNTKYYSGTVYEWNLPTGWTCPYALGCLVKVDRETGKFTNKSNQYKCYAASAERFPSARNARWQNFEYVKNGGVPKLPKQAAAVRIHAAGDFYNQTYFDMWVRIATENPNIEFWAYTKSVQFWVNSLGTIPNNLELTASYGGKQDTLIVEHDLKHVKVYRDATTVPIGLPIDINDDCARDKNIKQFALIDNFS